MSLKTLAVIYITGGLTFLPLLIALVLLPAWLLLPRAKDSIVGTHAINTNDGEDHLADSKPGELIRDEVFTPEGAASGTFAVLREYDFPTALSTLNSRNNAAPSSSGSGVQDVGSDSGGGGSESVYQSMYRTVFDRNKTAGSANTVLQNEDTSSAVPPKNGKKSTAANVYFVVLRHGHLMLYDNSAQSEVRHVISLAHHTTSITETEVGTGQSKIIPEADLFIKRTAIVLTPVEHTDAKQSVTPATRPKPFYLFCATCSDKEDFYHALLNTRASPPIPQAIAPEDAIKLQAALHSTSLTPETRALNALIGRIFLAVHRTKSLENLIRTKVENKIARVQKPAFIASLAVQSIDLGNAAPVLSNPRLKDLNISGDMTLAFDMRYNGALKIVVAAVAKIDLGQRFKTRTVNLVLATSLQRLQSHILVRIKPPPSNRLWFCFEALPEMDIKVEPVVSQRQITYAFILKAIEERIRAVVAETLVKPNWDDVPFFNTRQQHVRGGIWADEGVVAPGEYAAGELMSTGSLGGKTEKSMSMPSLPLVSSDQPDLGIASGAETTADAMSAALQGEQATVRKRKSAVPLPNESSSVTNGGRHMAIPPKPLRSPTLSSPAPSAPSVAMVEADVASVRADDASLQPKSWRPNSRRQQSRREAVEVVREMHDRSSVSADQGTSDEVTPEESAGEEDLDVKPARSLYEMSNDTSDSRRLSAVSLPKTIHMSGSGSPIPQRTDSEASTTSSQASRAQQQRKNIIAATAAATTAARNWSWNTIANRTKGTALRGTAQSGTHVPDEPIGRGQPLPPPGTPLPRPQRGWTAALGSVGSAKRKPVLPPRRGGPAAFAGRGNEPLDQELVTMPKEQRSSEDGLVPPATREDDFGPWRENSGDAFDSEHSHMEAESVRQDYADASQDGIRVTGSNPDPSEASGAGLPPPLPARPARQAQRQSSISESLIEPTTDDRSYSGNSAPDSGTLQHEEQLVDAVDLPDDTGKALEDKDTDQNVSEKSLQPAHTETSGSGSRQAYVEAGDESDSI